MLLGAVVAAAISAGGSAYYFLNQNYQIFIDLAYHSAPDLLKYLEREREWMNFFLVAMFSGMITFFLFLGLRMTARIIYPLLALERHLKSMTRGHWTVKELKIRENDEFQDLITSYNYFFRSLQIKTKQDLSLLEELKEIDMTPEQRRKLDRLISRQKNLIGYSNDSFSSDETFLGSRLAS